MEREWKQNTIVKDGGVIEVVLPDLHNGEQVEVIVRANSNSTVPGPRAGFGSARGLVRIAEDFDAPLEDFKDYV